MASTVSLAFSFMVVAFCFQACNSGTSVESIFPKEFFLPKKACFGRFFYQNDLAGKVEYELYCQNGDVVKLSESEDSLCLNDEISSSCLAREQFVSAYGQPLMVDLAQRKDVRFVLDTLETKVDSSMTGEGNNLHKINIQIHYKSNLLFDKVYMCNKLLQFDSNNISVYLPKNSTNHFIVDGTESCLIMEMANYDEQGEFAGWDRLSDDIKTITTL